MIHFDAHADTGDIAFGSLYGHGQPMRRLIESGALRGDRFLQIGLRGYWPGPGDPRLDGRAEHALLRDDRDRQPRARPPASTRRSRSPSTSATRSSSPSTSTSATRATRPGTGTPEPGGLSARELLDAVRRICRELPVAGIDVVEVSPPYDHAEITAFLANRVCLEALSGLAARRSASPTTRRDRCSRADDAPRSSATAPSSTATAIEAPGGRRVGEAGSSRSAPGTTRSTGLGPDDRVVDLAGGLLAPGFTDAHVHPIQGGLERLRCDLSEHATREEYLAAIRSYADGAPRRPVGPRRRLGDARLPRRDAAGRRPRRGRAGPAGVPAQPRPPRRLGQHAARWRSPASTADTPDPPDGRIERDADGNPTGTLHEGATALVSRHLPAHHRRGLPRRAAGRPGATCTRWASPAGRTRSSARTPGMDDPASTYVDAAASGELRSHVVGALWWDRRQGVEQVADLVGRREALTRRPVPRDHREDHAGRRGRERHRRDARALPRPLRARHRQPRPLLRRRRGAPGRGRRRWTPTASRCTCTRSATAAVRETLDALDGHRPGPPPPHRPPAAGPPRRRAAVRRARRGREHAGAVGLPRRADGRPDAAVPGGGARRAGSTPSATCTGPAPGWSRAATGRSRPPTRWRRSTPR